MPFLHLIIITTTFQGKFLMENVTAGVIVGNQTLALQRVQREQAGLYTCVASNTEGDGESNALYLDVKCKILWWEDFCFSPQSWKCILQYTSTYVVRGHPLMTSLWLFERSLTHFLPLLSSDTPILFHDTTPLGPPLKALRHFWTSQHLFLVVYQCALITPKHFL